jgi:hypothetical protein
MTTHVRWVLRQEHNNCEAPILVPVPKQTGTIEDLHGTPKDATTAAFLCTQCGFVTLYSQLHLDQQQEPDPYAENKLSLYYLLVGCVDNCEPRTKIYVVCDKATGKYKTTVPMQKWIFDSLNCERGQPLLFFPAESQPFYLTDMPF